MTSAYPHNTNTSATSGYNAQRFMAEMVKAGIMTCTIVKVVKNSSAGQVGAIGRVTVQPLVQMVDGIGQTVQHTSVFNLPYFRLGAGTKAIIMDPKAGDIGIVVVADRDVSGVKKSKKVSPPGSQRRYNISDGFYLSTVLADTPDCYIQFTDDKKVIVSVGAGSTPAQVVVAETHVQMKQKGVSDMHITVDIAGNQLIAGKTINIGPDPYPDD